MAIDKTQHQSEDAMEKARELSMEPTRPPANIEGYELEHFLGRGAYGEVWRATDQKTGRKVAIKFYTQRSAADVQQLAQEVEKLVVLSADRYVVQLLDVGWNAQPPYYVMDFIDQGSLEDQLNRQSVMPPGKAVELFTEIAQGMMHLHGKGILHCDLKPANILLDEDGKPRVADFGQSRLSTDQSAALGTLYYMAPEQADLSAAPDARWDVYALGAILYRMLTGTPPYRDQRLTDKIESSAKIGDRLSAYRKALSKAPAPVDHRAVPGVDRELADIISRCIAVRPNDRFPSIQSILFALRQRASRRERKPLLLLGIFGPLLLILGMSLFGYWAFNQATMDTREAVITKANESNLFKAKLAARSAAEQISEYFRVTEQLAKDESFIEAFKKFDGDAEVVKARLEIAHPEQNTDWQNEPMTGELSKLLQAKKQLLGNADRQALEAFLRKRMSNADRDFPVANSWFINDRQGNQIASIFEDETTNHSRLNNYAYRTYFTGAEADLKFDKPLKPSSGDRTNAEMLPADPNTRRIISKPHLSSIFLSEATNTWKVAFSSPILIDGETRGIVAVSVELGNFIDFSNGPDQYVMMIDDRTCEKTGAILEHPLIHEMRAEKKAIPQALSEKRLMLENISPEEFFDPMGDAEEGLMFRGRSIVAQAPISIQRKPVTTQAVTHYSKIPNEDEIVSIDTGLVVLAVEGYEKVIEPVNVLRGRLLRLLLAALLILSAVAFAMWWLVNRTLASSSQSVAKMFGPKSNQSWMADQETTPYDRS